MVRFGASFRQGLMHVYRRLGGGKGSLGVQSKEGKKSQKLDRFWVYLVQYSGCLGASFLINNLRQ